MSRIAHADEARPLDFEQQRKRAKELRNALARGDADAVRRFRTNHPKSAGLNDALLVERLAKVTEAQLVIARELGLPSWPRLRAHITRLATARNEVAAGASVLDADVPTMHIRCGTDILGGLRSAGLAGEFVEISDPYCQGPVPAEGDFLETRAQFIAAAYDVPLQTARASLLRIEHDLAASLQRERVVLWFEHDTFDQLILARILAFYGEHGAPRRLELVHIDHFPAVDRFHGLGELSAGALRMLWDDRLMVTSGLLALGNRVWRALRKPSPIALHESAMSSDALPQMGAAVIRHLQELPWCGDGLSLTQRLALELLVEGPSTAAEVFARLTNEREPLVHLGDSMFWFVLRDMCRAQPAPLVATATEAAWHRNVLTLTDAGRRVLNGELDWMACMPPERWVGGVRIRAGVPNWRWDPSSAAPRRD
ncbi:MAG: DUF1835 domain-containing protein [Gemmatimonadaceae bacterium]